MAALSIFLPHEDDPGIDVLFALREALGVTVPPGACRDCGGMTVIPDVAAAMAIDQAVWKTCPTCRGDGRGGNA